MHERISRANFEVHYPHLRTVFGSAWHAKEPSELLNVPNSPDTVYLSAALLDVNYQAVRRVALVEHVIQTPLAFLHPARYGFHVVRIEDSRAYLTPIVRSCAHLGVGAGRIDFIPPGVGEVVAGRRFLGSIVCTPLSSVEKAPRALRASRLSQAFDLEKSTGIWY